MNKIIGSLEGIDEDVLKSLNGRETMSMGTENVKRAVEFYTEERDNPNTVGFMCLLFLMKPPNFITAGVSKTQKTIDHLDGLSANYLPHITKEEVEQMRISFPEDFRAMTAARAIWPEDFKRINMSMIRTIALYHVEMKVNTPQELRDPLTNAWYSLYKAQPTKLPDNSSFYTSITGPNREQLIDNRKRLIIKIDRFIKESATAAKVLVKNTGKKTGSISGDIAANISTFGKPQNKSPKEVGKLDTSSDASISASNEMKVNKAVKAMEEANRIKKERAKEISDAKAKAAEEKADAESELYLIALAKYKSLHPDSDSEPDNEGSQNGDENDSNVDSDDDVPDLGTFDIIEEKLETRPIVAAKSSKTEVTSSKKKAYNVKEKTLSQFNKMSDQAQADYVEHWHGPPKN